MPACLLILVGLPGSGKTTLARRLGSALSSRYRVAHLEYDAAVGLSEQARLQAAAAAGVGDDGWRAARRELERAVEAAVTGNEVTEFVRGAIQTADDGADDDVEETAEGGRPTVFIIDDNMYLRSMRYRYFQLARRHQLGFAVVLLDVPVEECLRRNSARAQPVPAEAIEAMAARLERPDPTRLWEVRCAVLTGTQSPEGDAEELRRDAVTDELGNEGERLEKGKESDKLSGVTPEETETARDPDGSSPLSDLSVISDLVSCAFGCPVAPLVDNTLETDAARLVCSTNQLHQLDRHLRRLVGEHAAGCGVRARAANMARQRLMRRVRAGEMGLNVQPGEGERFAEAARALFEAEMATPAGKG